MIAPLASRSMLIANPSGKCEAPMRAHPRVARGWRRVRGLDCSTSTWPPRHRPPPSSEEQRLQCCYVRASCLPSEFSRVAAPGARLERKESKRDRLFLGPLLSKHRALADADDPHPLKLAGRLPCVSGPATSWAIGNASYCTAKRVSSIEACRRSLVRGSQTRRGLGRTPPGPSWLRVLGLGTGTCLLVRSHRLPATVRVASSMKPTDWRTLPDMRRHLPRTAVETGNQPFGLDQRQGQFVHALPPGGF
jgi:hypothetical protein